MKTTIVPAQITTVEDKIAGHFTLRQLLILVFAIFLDFIIFAVVPRQLKINAFKLLIIIFTTTLCTGLAYKHNDRIIASWTLLIFKYYKRPRIFIYNKNEQYLRQDFVLKAKEPVNKNRKINKIKEKTPVNASSDEIYKLNTLISEHSINIGIKNKKKSGVKLYVTAS
jgi:hypothetical protein